MFCVTVRYLIFLHFLLKTICRLLRKSDKPLQQIVKRLVELENLSIAKEKREFSLSVCIFRGEHANGPLTAGLHCNSIKQYKKLLVGPWLLTCKIPDSCVYLNDMTVICLENFVKTKDGSLLIGQQFRPKSDFYLYPIRSSCYNIYSISQLSDRLEAWSLQSFKIKAIKLPIPTRPGSFAVFPLYFENHNWLCANSACEYCKYFFHL